MLLDIDYKVTRRKFKKFRNEYFPHSTDPCPLSYIMLALCIAGLILIIAIIALMRNRG